jgi:hypothetical protein
MAKGRRVVSEASTKKVVEVYAKVGCASGCIRAVENPRSSGCNSKVPPLSTGRTAHCKFPAGNSAKSVLELLVIGSPGYGYDPSAWAGGLPATP